MEGRKRKIGQVKEGRKSSKLQERKGEDWHGEEVFVASPPVVLGSWAFESPGQAEFKKGMWLRNRSASGKRKGLERQLFSKFNS